MFLKLFTILTIIITLNELVSCFDLIQQIQKINNIVNNVTNISEQCKISVNNIILRAADQNLNALKILDASGKVPSGILSGNVNQYGDFDECMETNEAQYCLAEIDLEPLWTRTKFKHKNLLHSFYAFQTTFNDPAHRVPGFTHIRWGFCIPKQCSGQELKEFLNEIFGVNVNIRPGMCQTGQSKPIHDFGYYISRVFFTTLLLLLFTASAIDLIFPKFKEKNQTMLANIFLAFSLPNNWNDFILIKEDHNEIKGVHGVRAFSALALLMSHKSMALLYNPYINRTAMIKTFGEPWTIIAKNAILYTDCFILISGLLNANSLLNSLLKENSMKFKEKLITRIFRMTPNLIALILFCTYILPNMGSGPLWPMVVNHHSYLCKNSMWRNIFFIHNYFGFDKMCLTHSHQVGIDMQLFIFTPIVIYFVWISRRLGYCIILSLAIMSTILRFYATWTYSLSSVVYFGIPISRMFNTADYSYILPTHRATVYLMGVYLACLLKFSRYNLNIYQKIFCWVFFCGAFIGAWFGPNHMGRKDYVYDKTEAAINAALAPILWSSGVAFAIYATNRNFGGFIQKILCWKYFQYATKIGYSLYLVQFPIFFYNVGKTRHIDEYKTCFLLPIEETTVIILASVILTLCVEMPFSNIRKVFLETKRNALMETEVNHNKYT